MAETQYAIDALRSTLAIDIEREGSLCSFMIRAWLLADLLDELAQRRTLPTEQELRETIAQEIEAWKPDASFDDSQIGAQEVRAVIQNCADIARRGRDYPGVAAVRRESE